MGLALILASGCQPESVVTVDPPLGPHELARIGSATITVETFQTERARAGSATSDEGALLDRLIRRELLYAEAQRVGFDQSSAVQAAWKNLVIQRFQEELETQAESGPAPIAAEVEAEYTRHPEHYAFPAQVRAALIQLPAASGPLAAEVRTEALRTSTATEDFGSLASRSIHPSSRRQGGDLGWLTRAQAVLAFPQEVAAALFALSQPGEVSVPVNTTEGVFLLKLIEMRPARAKPLEAVREQIAYELQRRRRAAAEQQIYDRLGAIHPVQTNPQRLAELSDPHPELAARPPRLPSR